MIATESIQTDERGLLAVCAQCGRRNRMNYERLGQTFRCGHCQTELPSPGEPVHVGSQTSFDALISQSALPVLVDFWAPWCGPCKMAEPEFVKAAAEGAGKWIVAKANTEELPDLAQRFGINAIPTVMLFKKGREVARKTGAMPAATIRQFIERNGRR